MIFDLPMPGAVLARPCGSSTPQGGASWDLDGGPAVRGAQGGPISFPCKFVYKPFFSLYSTNEASSVCSRKKWPYLEMDLKVRLDPPCRQLIGQ